VGETVLPFPEDEISKAAIKHFPQFQYRFGPLAERLSALGVAGADQLREVNQQIAELLQSDASDAPKQLGAEESSLYDGLKWAREVDLALKAGLERTIQELQRHRGAIEALRSTGVPGDLRNDLADEMAQLNQRLGQPSFYRHAADFATALTAIKVRVRGAAEAMQRSLVESVSEARQDLARLTDWPELTQEEQIQAQAQLDDIETAATLDLAGLELLLAQEAELWAQVRILKKQIAQRAHDRRVAQQQAGNDERFIKDGRTKVVRIPAIVTSAIQLADVIAQLQAIQAEIEIYDQFEFVVDSLP
jgi:hypothetical protein